MEGSMLRSREVESSYRQKLLTMRIFPIKYRRGLPYPRKGRSRKGLVICRPLNGQNASSMIPKSTRVASVSSRLPVSHRDSAHQAIGHENREFIQEWRRTWAPNLPAVPFSNPADSGIAPNPIHPEIPHGGTIPPDTWLEERTTLPSEVSKPGEQSSCLRSKPLGIFIGRRLGRPT